MSVIAQAIADREAEIERLQAEIKALTDVEQLLGASAASPARARRSSRFRAAAATAESKSDAKPSRKRRPMSAAEKKAVAESKSDAKPSRKRRPMSVAEKKAVSERMTAYWAERRKKAAKK